MRLRRLTAIMRTLAVASLVGAATGPVRAATAAPSPVPLIDGLGPYRSDATLPSAVSRRYFDQGMVLAWGFNPGEAARAFEAAASSDRRCAICWWGLAWSLGPTINADVAPGDEERIVAALARARGAARHATPRDRALIAALARRHPPAREIDERAYAAAMDALARTYPRDPDVLTLAAEAHMNLHPYDWWTADGTAQPWTRTIEQHLARALAVAPEHPGANHYWVHLMEPSRTPERALPSAARLETLTPGVGHLLHMPAHIYMRVGRYADASTANERAIAADRRYLDSTLRGGTPPRAPRSQENAGDRVFSMEQVQAPDAYRIGYAAHNHHFLWASAAMEGRSRAAIEAARATYRVACGPRPGAPPRTGTLQHYYALPYYALVRFGQWDELLRATPPPDVPLPYPLAAWHYARGTAYARTGRVELARRELAEVERLAAAPEMRDTKVKQLNFATGLARIAVLSLAADIALAAGRAAQAVDLLTQATATEDAFEYDEPHLWLAPTRHALGAALLAANRPAAAERVYREDLWHYPENGWSLHGLARALAAQGRHDEARAAQERYRTAWKAADITLAP